MRQNSRRPRRGFTLIELLTVIAVVGILFALSFFGVTRVRASARRAQCISNLRQIGNALHTYAGEYRGNLPDNSSGGAWAWDVKYEIIQRLGRPGDLKDIVYCPNGEFPEKDMLWDGFKSGGFRAIGYVLLLPGTPSLDPAVVNSRLTSPPVMNSSGVLTTPSPAQRELAVDATISLGPGNFTHVQGMAPTPHRANHLDGSRPAGGNILFLDGHVDWRPFAQMNNHVIDLRRAWFWW